MVGFKLKGYIWSLMSGIIRHEKRHRRACTVWNVDVSRKFHAYSTEFFSYTLLKVEILWICYLYYTMCSFKYTFKGYERYFSWKSNSLLQKFKTSNLQKSSIPQNVSAEDLNLSHVSGVFWLPSNWSERSACSTLSCWCGWTAPWWCCFILRSRLIWPGWPWNIKLIFVYLFGLESFRFHLKYF